MAISVFDSLLLRDMFGTPAMQEILDERAFIARCADARPRSPAPRHASG